MIDKNMKKERAKKQRNLWTMNPVTRTVESNKNYNRARDRKSEELYDYEDDIIEEEELLDETWENA